MKSTLRKRIISGLLAGLMCISNMNMPVSAADFIGNDSDSIIETDYQEETEPDTQETETADETDLEESAEPVYEEEETDQLIDVETEEAETEPEDAMQTAADTFQVSGAIAYQDKLDGTDWSTLVRPAEFDQPMKITLKYMDADQQEQEITYDSQEHLSQNAFYLKFTHDGEGGGDFTITNIPKTVTGADGVAYPVTMCEINVAPTLPYYQSEHSISADPSNHTSAIGTLVLDLKYQILTLHPTVVPEEESGSQMFAMDAVFTNPNQEGKTLAQSYRISVANGEALKVPLALDYRITQKPTEGYRFDGIYRTEMTGADVTESPDYAEGSIIEGKDITVTTVNYAQNISVGFDVTWIDNQKVSRPAVSEDTFTLQYRTEDGTWTDLTAEKYEELGITNPPEFDTSKAALHQYAYTGLPAVDANGKALSYQVLVKKNPTGYCSEYSDNADARRTFLFEEQTDFSAQIIWNDGSDSQNRPENIAGLHLYRRVENGNYELVYEELPDHAISKEKTAWTVNIADLPRYNRQNQEYDYVLIQGTIGENNTVTQIPLEKYKTYYDNGTGNFGNDIAWCHNGGKITEVLYDEIEFHAQKIWKDDGNTEQRPNVTVTLWRYVENTAADIDEAYEKGLASHVMSYTLDKTKNTDITFSHETVSDMSENEHLPQYDDQGQKYIYFVRESLSGTYADDYEIQYSQNDRVYHNGTPADGTITNVHRKKEAVNITKLWQDPSGLAAIDGASVTVTIKASADGGKTFDELTVYSGNTGSYEELEGDQKKKAQTISGFSSSLSQREVSYYVNTCNRDGLPYDMTTAQITETVITGDGTTVTAQPDGSGHTILTLNGQTYRVGSVYEGSNSLGNQQMEYRYKMTNTITAERTYQLIKKWDQSISQDEIADVTSVNFRLERRSMRSNADGTQAAYEEVLNTDGKNLWQVAAGEDDSWENTLTGLPAYDEEGYAYYYRATEISFTKTDGTTLTTDEAYRTLQWSGIYERTADQTKVVNYKATTQGRSYFSVSKIWQDNGDTDARKSVKIRVYKRSDLQAALENLEENVEINLDQLPDVKYYEAAISSREQDTAFVYYRDLEKAIDGQEWPADQKDSWENYIVLEYCAGEKDDDEAQPARYTVENLKNAAETAGKYGIIGTVENADRKYEVTASVEEDDRSGSVFLTNTRTGVAGMKITKNWEDENDAAGLRPDTISFQLYQDGTEYTGIPETVAVQDEEESAITAELDRATGKITVSSAESGNTDAQWSFSITGLRMFSAAGIPYSYDVEELGEEQRTDAERQYDYQQRKEIPEVNATGKSLTYTFSFTNTISGTITHTAYKYWKDSGVGASNRPDLYMNLYQYLKKDQREHPDTAVDALTSCKLYKDYKDQIWSAQPQSSQEADYESGYDWKITVEELPRFDEHGEEYGYLFRESMNHDGKTVLGTYQSQAETKTAVSGDDTKDPDTYEVFTNTITDRMSVQGKKTWTGLSGYQTKEEDLPDPLITLYRTTDASVTNLQNKSEKEIEELIRNNTIEKVAETRLTDGKTKYIFRDVEKFDEEGKRYQYLVRETIEETIAGQLYSQVNVNGTLSNIFRRDVNRRNIEVTKNWGGRTNLKTDENQYPSVTYTLYRYEPGREEETRTQIETHTINADEFTGTDGKASYTFRDLLIYSPTGVQYAYYVTEKQITGYSVIYQDEEGLTDAALKKNDRMDVISLPEKWNDVNADEEELTAHVGTTNTYSEAGNITISGKKIWKDEKNSENLRPDRITVMLTRSTHNENGQNNKVNSVAVDLIERESRDETVTEPYIVWERGTDPYTSESWSYTIYNLERYAPNGMPYIYTVAEQQVEGYQRTNAVNSEATAEKVAMPDITNQYAGSYYVRKNWMDGNNKYNLRPADITVQLQRTADDGATWTDYQDPVTLSKANEIKNTRGNSWEYTFTNLPTQNKDGDGYRYRCVELAIGGVPVQNTEIDGEMYDTAGAYVRSYRLQNETRTVIENTLRATSLEVTKVWQGDQDNLYQTRPESLTFILQKRSIQVADTEEEEDVTGEWVDVKNADGSPYTFKITPDGNGNWSAILEDLPVAEVQTDEDGQTHLVYSLYFRAVEVHEAKNYQDTTDYTDDSKDHIYDEQQGRNISTITNVLRLDDPVRSISVTKTWRRTGEGSATAMFELLYKKTDEAEENWHSYDPALTQTVTTNDSETETAAKWEDLPAYDRDGAALVYKVIEHPVKGYRADVAATPDTGTGETTYAFTNIQLQNYTMKKIWKNASYAQKTNNGYTATFQLQQKIGDDDSANWTEVADSEITLTSKMANDSAQNYTWKDLPMYTTEGTQIRYRAAETKINGIPVENATNGAYNVSYSYATDTGQASGHEEPTFRDTVTVAENRMIYGFVNLTKVAAYLAPEMTPDHDRKLSDVVFCLEKDGSVYASEIKTDTSGNLKNNHGKYGKEEKYLVAGTYTLKEISAGTDYSIWDKGVTFTVGTGNKNGDVLTDTGEHGTAWIKTTLPTTFGAAPSLGLDVQYQEAVAEDGTVITKHTFEDECSVQANHTMYAYDLESRGVLTFTKTGADGALDTHIGASGEKSAYFGVYLDQACTQQVAGMVPKSAESSEASDRTAMILTDTMQDGSALPSQLFNANGIPYLRAYNSQTHPEYPFTLLSGTYYIKELTAPAGYKLDTVVRKVVVSKIKQTAMDTDLSDAYAENKAQIMKDSEQTGNTDYQWSNEPTVLTLYKMDQYGRKVPLKENGYLILTLQGEGNTFPSGESEIFLYQDQEKPATAKDQTTAVGNIQYHADAGSWTITGLLDAGKTYTLSEPETSVHDNYLLADAISFQMNEDGGITLVQDGDEADGAQEKENPIAADGTDYRNCYKSDAAGNLIVLRDVVRYLKDVALQKRDSVTDASIANISFELYKYDGTDTEGKLKNLRAVLETGSYLTTDQSGRIDLKDLSDDVKNQITGCALKYGLDVGSYYWKEVERGASDKYRLADDIFFEIRPGTPQEGETDDYDHYATVEFRTEDTHVTTDPDGKTVIVKNDPVSSQPKTLNLIKTDSQNDTVRLKKARFVLSYQSVNHGDAGAETGGDAGQNLSWNCITDAEGILYLSDENGNICKDKDGKPEKPDISRKGTYTLKEMQAPDGYMTCTENGTAKPVIMVTFQVNEANKITGVTCYHGPGALVTGQNPMISTDAQGEQVALNLLVKNEKTKASVQKLSDIAGNRKTCNQMLANGEPLSGATLQIYEGIYDAKGSTQSTLIESLTDGQDWTLPEGLLKENTIYTLHESSTPVGYLTADDIYFMLFGTTGNGNDTVSQIYVWSGTGTPVGTVTDPGWVKNRNLKEASLAMVDEVVIAPVNLQKVMESADQSSRSALADVEFTVKDLDTQKILGTTVTAQSGYLGWKEITSEGYASGLIYNEVGQRVTSGGKGGNIILKQNEHGYVFTESYAPDGVYNNQQSLHVSITAENYRQYRTANKIGTLYQANRYINLARSEGNTDHQVANLSVIGDPAEPQVVNLMSASFELTKKVEGNMGDKNGVFRIHLKVFAADGKTLLGEREIELKANETYDSETGREAFGKDAIPAGAVIEISEELATDYDSRIEVSRDGSATVLSDEKGTIRVRLNTSAKASLELVNRKEMQMDLGVHTDQWLPEAVMALILPLLWLFFRHRRRYRGGGGQNE